MKTENNYCLIVKDAYNTLDFYNKNISIPNYNNFWLYCLKTSEKIKQITVIDNQLLLVSNFDLRNQEQLEVIEKFLKDTVSLTKTIDVDKVRLLLIDLEKTLTVIDEKTMLYKNIEYTEKKEKETKKNHKI